MPTKAELEKELDRLKEELAELRAAGASAAADAAETAADTVDDIGARAKDGASSLMGTVDDLTHELIAEIEEMPAKKTLLVAAGAFLLGYVLGHSNRR